MRKIKDDILNALYLNYVHAQVKNRHIMSKLYIIRELVKTMCENKNIINEYNGELRSCAV